MSAKRSKNKGTKNNQSRKIQEELPQSKRDWYIIVAIALFVVTFAVYWNVLQNAFVNLDDGAYVTENVHVQEGFTQANLIWAFTTGLAGNWHPLTWLSHMLDCKFYGLRPSGHHLTNLLLHSVNSVLLFWFLRCATGATFRSGLVAGLFALHPIHVESVAWVAERKDVLSTFFFFLTLIAYCKGIHLGINGQKKGAGNSEVRLSRSITTVHTSSDAAIASKIPFFYYTMALLLFSCGLMSKPMLVTVPCVLVLLDFWPFARLKFPLRSNPPEILRRRLLEKVPFFILSGAVSLLTIVCQNGAGALNSFKAMPLDFRIANAIFSYWRYLAQIFWPINLAVFYPFPKIFSFNLMVAALVSLVVVTWLLFWQRRTKAYLAIGWFWWLVTSLPVIGLIQVGGQSHADRYMYIPSIGIFIILVWWVCDKTRQWRHQFIVPLFAISLLFTCAVITRNQISYWNNSETLFHHAIAVTPDNFAAYGNIAQSQSLQGRTDEALENYRLAVDGNPDSGDAQAGLGSALLMKGRVDEAIDHLQISLRIKPDQPITHCNLASAYSMKGRWADAVREYNEGLRLRPEDGKAHRNLGLALEAQGNLDAALIHYEEGLRLEPNVPEINLSMGIALAKKGNSDKAIYYLREALRLNPNLTAAQQELRLLGVPAPTEPAPSTP